MICFRLTENSDPEERLEEAALWKAMHDEYGDGIVALGPDQIASPGMAVFGRGRRNPSSADGNPVADRLEYWRDPAFVAAARRRFAVVPFERLAEEVGKLHAKGRGAFVKSTRSKHAIFRIPAGTSVTEAVGDMAYSFMDGGPGLMVQELCGMRFEHRFFCIDREIVAESPVQWSLTPLDYPLPPGSVFETPRSEEGEWRPEVVAALKGVAASVARHMEVPHAAVDCALIDGVPGVVELNPMRLGQLGLYAADVRALARASRRLLHGFGRDVASLENAPAGR